MIKPVISIKGLCFSYPGSDSSSVLSDISLDVYPGEVVALLGPNGSGKSTLARHINALLTPTKGEVLVDGLNTKDKDAAWEIRKRVGMVFQNPDNQLVAALVEEELAFGMENLGLTPEIMRERIKTIAAKMNLSELLDFPPHRLSGGQKQRVAIAAVLAIEPQVLVLDEPTSMLDPSGRAEVMAQVASFKGTGKTVVLVTHDMDEAATADRIIVLEKGKVAIQGTPEECFSGIINLKELGLTIPPAAELSRRLKSQGINVPGTMLRVEDWVDYLCQ